MANYCQFEITFDTETNSEAFCELSVLRFKKLCEKSTVNPATVHPMPRTSPDDPLTIYGECKWTAEPAVKICKEFLEASQIESASIIWSELGCEGLGLINVYFDEDGVTSHSEVYRAEPPTTITEIKRVIKECPAVAPQLEWYLDDLEAEAEADA